MCYRCDWVDDDMIDWDHGRWWQPRPAIGWAVAYYEHRCGCEYC